MKLQRYKILTDICDKTGMGEFGGMGPDNDGEWVKYEDAMEYIKERLDEEYQKGIDEAFDCVRKEKKELEEPTIRENQTVEPLPPIEKFEPEYNRKKDRYEPMSREGFKINELVDAINLLRK